MTRVRHQHAGELSAARASEPIYLVISVNQSDLSFAFCASSIMPLRVESKSSVLTTDTGGVVLKDSSVCLGFPSTSIGLSTGM